MAASISSTEGLRAIDPSLGKTGLSRVTIRNKPPKLAFLPIEKLFIDDEYQRQLRPTTSKAIRRLAENFNWAHFSTVPVAALDDGNYAILDGQHRVHAAAAIGIESVPCQIMKIDRKAQAAAFAAINGDVTVMTVWALYKADLCAGSLWAVRANQVCRNAGCKLMTSNKSASFKMPGEIFAIRLIRDIVEQKKDHLLEPALSIWSNVRTAITLKTGQAASCAQRSAH